jgi:preprotein translocase subunit SecG
MNILITVLIVFVCISLTFIVLVQNSKGGGLASNFAGSNQVMGVRKTADFLEKATWTLAGSLVFLCILAVFMLPKAGSSGDRSILDSQIDNATEQMTTQPFPSTAPAIEIEE